MYKAVHFCGHIAAQFNNCKLVFTPPPNKHKTIGHEIMDPNELARIEIPRSGSWIKSVIEEILTNFMRSRSCGSPAREAVAAHQKIIRIG